MKREMCEVIFFHKGCKIEKKKVVFVCPEQQNHLTAIPVQGMVTTMFLTLEHSIQRIIKRQQSTISS